MKYGEDQMYPKWFSAKEADVYSAAGAFTKSVLNMLITDMRVSRNSSSDQLRIHTPIPNPFHALENMRQHI